MVRIDKISVKNYKNIEKADVKFGSLNVLVGPNGSGKSNFLTVTSFVNTIVNGSNETVKILLNMGRNLNFGRFFSEITYGEEKRNDKAKESLHIEIEFSDNSTGFVYSYSLSLIRKNPFDWENKDFLINEESFTYKKKGKTGKAITLMAQKNSQLTLHKPLGNYFSVGRLREQNVSGIKLLDLILKTNSDLNNEYGHAINSLNSVLKINTIYLSSHALKHNNYEAPVSLENRLINFNLEEQIINLDGTDQWSTFKNAVKNILGFNDVIIVDIKHSKQESQKIVGYYRRTRAILMTELSDGEILLIGLIAKIVTNTSDIIFIEELENSIHPKALQSLIELMSSYCETKQFLISTHSATLLNMIKPENVFVSTVNQYDLAEITMISNIKELKKKLSHGFINFGDLLYQNTDKNSNKFEDIF